MSNLDADELQGQKIAPGFTPVSRETLRFPSKTSQQKMEKDQRTRIFPLLMVFFLNSLLCCLSDTVCSVLFTNKSLSLCSPGIPPLLPSFYKTHVITWSVKDISQFASVNSVLLCFFFFLSHFPTLPFRFSLQAAADGEDSGSFNGQFS